MNSLMNSYFQDSQFHIHEFKYEFIYEFIKDVFIHEFKYEFICVNLNSYKFVYKNSSTGHFLVHPKSYVFS